MNAWDTVLGQRTMENINSLSRCVEDNTPTLRDQFAMAALSATVGGTWNGSALNIFYKDMNLEKPVGHIEHLAKVSYAIADAMLAERSKE